MKNSKSYYFLLLFIFLAPGVYAQCTDLPGYSLLGEYEGQGYYLSDTTLPWAQAKTLAENEEGYLATMNKQAENDFLQSQLNGNMVFIGYNDAETEESGQWTNGEPVTLDLSYGNSDESDYAVMNFWDGGWQMNNGMGHRKFVMEKECEAIVPSGSCLVDGIYFSSQADLDAFPSEYPDCKVIEGDIRISGSTVTNLLGLSQIEKVNGNLEITGTYSLFDVEGLNNLEEVGGTLRIGRNIIGGYYNDNIPHGTSIQTLSGLENLRKIESFQMMYNDSLKNFVGLENLETVDGDFWIGGYEVGNHTNTYPPDNLDFFDNKNLESMEGLSGLKSIGGTLTVCAQSKLTNLSPLNALTHVGSLRVISQLDFSLDGLEQVDVIGSINLGIDDAYFYNGLYDISALSHIDTIYGSFSISNSGMVAGTGTLTNLKEIKGTLSLSETNIDNLDWLPSLNKVSENLNLTDNQNLSKCTYEWLCSTIESGADVTISNNKLGCENLPEVITNCSCGEMEGYSKLGNYWGHGYYLSTVKEPWESAEILSENAGGYLATINNQAENDFLKNQLNGTMAFIGYNDTGEEGIGQWSNNEPVTLDLSYDNSEEADYGLMNFWDGGWQMTNGLGHRYFVIESECGVPPPPKFELLTIFCPNEYPMADSVINLTIQVANTGGKPTTPKQYDLSQDEHCTGGGFVFWSNQSFGTFDIPSIAPSDTLILTESFTLSGVNRPGYYWPGCGKWGGGERIIYDFSFGDKTLPYYCKKYSTDLSLEILTDSYVYYNDINYQVVTTNNGLDTAFNFWVQLQPGIPHIDSQNDDDWKHINYLAPGASKTFTVEKHFYGQVSSYELTLYIDAGHNIDTNPGDEEASITFFSQDAICEGISGLTKLGEYQDHVYYLSDTTVTWAQAKTLSENVGGYLATMNTQGENDFLKSQLNGNMAFIGYNDAGEEGIGQWANGESAILDLSNDNSDESDFAVMNFWDGSWQMTNGLGHRKYAVEVNCASQKPGASPNQFAYENAVDIQGVYPNPANNMITLNLLANEEKLATITIIDAHGQLILSEKRDLPKGLSKLKMDVSELPEGMYFVKEVGTGNYENFVIQQGVRNE